MIAGPDDPVGQALREHARADPPQAALAKAAGLSTTGLNNIERGDADPKASTLEAIHAALESAGVEFIPENGGGAGVRLKKK